MDIKSLEIQSQQQDHVECDILHLNLKPKESQKCSEGALGSKKKKKFEKTKCPYCMRGFHPEIQCMKKNIDQFSYILEQNSISLPHGAN